MTNTTAQAVPDRYRGVWVRTLLQTPTLRDDTTFVRWLQTSSWHADLRVPATARPISATDAVAQRASQTGFCGMTTVERQGDDEVCIWHREFDFQPPGLHPDAGRIVFETPDRLIERGVHGDYLEVWERLPGSGGRVIALEGPAHTRLLIAGDFAMLVKPRTTPWPADVPAGASLAQVIEQHPDAASALLDFEISYGRFKEGLFAIEHSSRPECDHSQRYCHIQRLSNQEAMVLWGGEGAEVQPWRIHDWVAPKI
jgi:hypothetical protein